MVPNVWPENTFYITTILKTETGIFTSALKRWILVTEVSKPQTQRPTGRSSKRDLIWDVTWCKRLRTINSNCKTVGTSLDLVGRSLGAVKWLLTSEPWSYWLETSRLKWSQFCLETIPGESTLKRTGTNFYVWNKLDVCKDWITPTLTSRWRFIFEVKNKRFFRRLTPKHWKWKETLILKQTLMRNLKKLVKRVRFSISPFFVKEKLFIFT